MVRGLLSIDFGVQWYAMRLGALRSAVALFTLILGATSVAGVTDDQRLISFYNIHTEETIEVVYKRNGRYVADSMKEINHIMRDWRRDEPTKMDPKLIDLIWELHTQLGSQKPIHLISGYRSKKTNERLRRKGGGQARNSRHILGKAADIHFPDVSAKLLRNSALVRERGGVGYYPTSAIPFVHVDTSGVRHWPRLPRLELASLFPDGKTRHRPRKGGPITKKDYKKAMAKLSAKQKKLVQIARGEIKPDRTAPVVTRLAQAPAPKKIARPVKAVQLASLSPDRPLWGNQPLLNWKQASSSTSSGAPIPVKAPQAPLQQFVTASLGGLDTNSSSSMTGQAGSRSAAASVLPPDQDIIVKQQNRMIVASADPMADLINRDRDSSGSLGVQASPQGWDRAPSFDDDHDDELAYQPFPILPLMGKLTTAPGGYFAKMTPPEQTNVMALLGERDILPMQLRQGLDFAQMLWANEFKGLAVATLAMGQGSSHAKTKQYVAASN